MERAYAADRVDISIRGDWEDIQVELGLKAARETPRPPLFPMLAVPELDESQRTENAGKVAAKKKKARRKQVRASRKRNRKRR